MSRGFRSVSLRALALVAVLAVARPGSLAAQGTTDTTFTLSRAALVDITVRYGALVVRGTGRSGGELRTTRGGYELRATSAGLTVVPSARGRRRSDTDDERVELVVPRGVRLVIAAGNADVDVRDIDGEVEVHSSGGDIVMQRLGARAIVETFSGDLSIDGGVGDVRVTSTSGDVTVRGLRGAADVTTTSGDITLADVRTSRITIQSISGDADISGTINDDARVQVSTHSGDVGLELLGSVRGTLEFETHMGELSTSGPLTMVAPVTAGLVGQRDARNRQRFEFGGGGAMRLLVTTFNGDLRFVRGPSRSPD